MLRVVRGGVKLGIVLNNVFYPALSLKYQGPDLWVIKPQSTERVVEFASGLKYPSAVLVCADL